MYRNGYTARGTQRWVCGVYRRDVSRTRYDTLDGLRYNRFLLLNRRAQWFRRLRRREELS